MSSCVCSFKQFAKQIVRIQNFNEMQVCRPGNFSFEFASVRGFYAVHHFEEEISFVNVVNDYILHALCLDVAVRQWCIEDTVESVQLFECCWRDAAPVIAIAKHDSESYYPCRRVCCVPPPEDLVDGTNPYFVRWVTLCYIYQLVGKSRRSF